MQKKTFPLLLAAALCSADATAKTSKSVDCYCTDKSGARVELGQTRCMNVGGRLFMARCEMSLNVPMWREQDGSCLTG